MKTLLKVSILSLLFVATSSQCFAMIGHTSVSKAKAKEMGIELRFTANGTNEVWVELEFKPTGELKDFSQVRLEIRDGEKFLMGWTALKDERTSSGSVKVTLMANRVYLEKVTLRVVVGQDGLGNGKGYDLRVKDFVEPEKTK